MRKPSRTRFGFTSPSTTILCDYVTPSTTDPWVYCRAPLNDVGRIYSGIAAGGTDAEGISFFLCREHATRADSHLPFMVLVRAPRTSFFLACLVHPNGFLEARGDPSNRFPSPPRPPC
jgi:hypothetical protein